MQRKTQHTQNSAGRIFFGLAKILMALVGAVISLLAIAGIFLSRCRIVLLSLMLGCLTVAAQVPDAPVQVVRGSVADAATGQPLPGAAVIVEWADGSRGMATDTDGRFRFDAVPVGRCCVRAAFVGYAPQRVSGCLVTSGREVVLDIRLDERPSDIAAVEVVGSGAAIPVLERMQAVRSFTVEEASRYAGGIDDPARLATAFAGVSAGGNVQDNAISVHGNAPSALLWCIDGIEVPNPCHFSGGNVAGGGFVTNISSNVMANSDFHTAAFPSEFGNAIGGVFDIRLRQGNADRSQHAFQVGVMGIDAASEGPLAGGDASYLFNYRYSTLGLMGHLGLVPEDQAMYYQDLSFKVHAATKAGQFSLWGVGSADKLRGIAETDSSKWEDDQDRCRNLWKERSGVVGLTHSIAVGRFGYLRTTAAAYGCSKDLTQDRLDSALVFADDMDVFASSGKLTLQSTLSGRFGRSLSVSLGAAANNLLYDFDFSGTEREKPGTYAHYASASGSAWRTAVFAQARYAAAARLSLRAGLRVEHFGLTGSTTVEPRASLTWQMTPLTSVLIAYGLHSRYEDLSVYLVADNRNLRPTQASHFVVSLSRPLGRHWHAKAEAYLQTLTDIPCTPDGAFAMVNFKQDFTFRRSLVNNALGRNYGLDLTLERPLAAGYYCLFSGTVHSSRYRPSNGRWRSTAWDDRYTVNALFGREMYVGSSRHNVLGFNIKCCLNGGRPYTPVDIAASDSCGAVVENEDASFSLRDGAECFVDFSATYRINRRRHSSVFTFSVNNLLGTEQRGSYVFNHRRQTYERDSYTYRLPIVSYKLEF